MSISAKYGYFIYISTIKFYIMNISFTEKQQNYISNQVQSGDFQNASEVVRDALRLHEIYRHRIIEDLRREIELGWEGRSKRNVLDIIKDNLAELNK